VASPSDDPSLTASIRAPLIQTVGDTTNLIEQPMFASSLDGQFTGPLDIAMTAGQNVDLNSVSIWLMDGVSVSPDVNTFSHEDLLEDFVTTGIPAGTIRTLRFHTSLRCGLRTPQSVAAEIRFVEASGRKNSITVTTPFQTTVIVQTGP
jgi:hypothetical protein